METAGETGSDRIDSLALTDNRSGFDLPRGRTTAALRPALHTGTLALPVKIFLVCVVLPFAFGLGPVVMTGVRLVLIFLVPVMAVRLIAGKAGKMLPTDVLFFLHWLWMGVTIGITNPDSMIQNVGATGVEFLGGYFLGRTFIRSKADMIGLIRFSALLIALTLPFAIHETLTGRSIIIEVLRALPVVEGPVKDDSLMRMGLNRVQMDFATPIHYGVYCTIMFSFCYFGMKSVYVGFKRYLVTLVIFACVFLSLSSGALLPVMLQLFFIIWAYLFRKSARRWWYLLAWLAFCYVTIDLLSNRTPYRVFMSYATFSAANAYWRANINEFGMENVWANPIFGIGFNYWKRPSWMGSSSVDNYWLLMAMRHGIPGFLLVAAGYGVAVWQVIRAKLGDGDDVLLQLRLAWVFTLFSLAFTMITVHVWSEIYSVIFFHIGAGMWLVGHRPVTADSTAVVAGPQLRTAPVTSRALAQTPAVSREVAPPPVVASGPTLGHTRSLQTLKTTLVAGPATRPAQASPETEADEGQRHTRFPTRPRDPDKS